MTEKDALELWLEFCARYIPLESRPAWKAMILNKIIAIKGLPAIGQKPYSISRVLNLRIVHLSNQSPCIGMNLLPELKNRGEENTIASSAMVPKSMAECCETDLPFAWLKKMHRSG